MNRQYTEAWINVETLHPKDLLFVPTLCRVLNFSPAQVTWALP
jgi:hypothetical protein